MSPLLVIALFASVAAVILVLTLPAAPPSGAQLRARMGGHQSPSPQQPALMNVALHTARRAPHARTMTLILVVVVIAAALVGPIGGLVGGAVGACIALAMPYRAQAARRRAFAQSLPDALSLLAGGLAAGHALAASLETTARECSGPVAEELTRVVHESRLGLPLDEGLRRVAERMRCPELSWAIEAMTISREVGGELGTVLGTVAATARERETHRRRVRALTAEGRLSAVVLTALPPLFAAYLVLTRREYVSVLVTEPLGQALLLLAVGMLAVGSLWMRLLVHGDHERGRTP